MQEEGNSGSPSDGNMEKLEPLTDDDIVNKRSAREAQLAMKSPEEIKEWNKKKRLAVFIIPTQNLVE
jgi:hypothetical protein